MLKGSTGKLIKAVAFLSHKNRKKTPTQTQGHKPNKQSTPTFHPKKNFFFFFFFSPVIHFNFRV